MTPKTDRVKLAHNHGNTSHQLDEVERDNRPLLKVYVMTGLEKNLELIVEPDSIGERFRPAV